MALTFNAGSRLLFIGDSITDCGRRDDPQGVGEGYVLLVRDWLRSREPTAAPVVMNRGISGNKVTDLKTRWERDVIADAPDVVSVMIGINDVWHGFAPDGASVEIDAFRSTYREILMELRARRPGCRLVLCEPTIISPPAPQEGNDALRPYVRVVNDLAQDLLADAVVRLHDVFRDAERTRPDIDWTTDGVHPTSTGHALIARTWLAATELL
ncbi:MAG: SGNH/GDSL hydrolase family protein [Tepidisphaeraceae bacterium]